MRKKILISVLSIVAFGAAVLSSALIEKSANNPLSVVAETVNSSVLIADKYVLGDVVELPRDATLEYDGQTYAATVTLRDPDGRGYSGDQVLLNMAGQYTVEYKAVMENGWLIKETQVFDCYDTLYSVDGNSSKIAYGVFENYANAKSGLAVDLFAGETLTVNKMLDVSKLSYDGAAFESIISLYVAPYTLYSEDVSQLRFTLTDAYDEANQVTVVLKKFTTTVIENEKTYAIHSYVTAGANTQQQIGLERIATGDFDYGDGNLYKVHKNNFYGSAIQFSMTGGFKDVGSYVGKDEVAFSMDYENGEIYSQTVRAGITQRGLVTDLDDRRLYDDLWQGFTTGEVYLSVEAMNYKAPSCRFVITDLLGISQELMQKNSFKDEQAPAIAVQFNGESGVPQAIVGREYPVFTATAQDNYDGEVSVHTAVWANYKKMNAFRLSLTNGRFIPLQEMEYSIVYTAKDRAGNISEEVVRVAAVSDLDRISIQLGEKALSGKAGTEFEVAAPNLFGGTGNKYVNIRAIHQEFQQVQENGALVCVYFRRCYIKQHLFHLYS